MMLITDADVSFKSTSERRAYRRAARSECPAALGAASGWWCRRSHLPSSAPQSPETSTVLVPPGRCGETANGEAEAERRQRESRYFLHGRKVKAGYQQSTGGWGHSSKRDKASFIWGGFIFRKKVSVTWQQPSDGSLPLRGASPPLSLVSTHYFSQFRARHLNRLPSHALRSQLLSLVFVFITALGCVCLQLHKYEHSVLPNCRTKHSEILSVKLDWILRLNQNN